MLERITLRGLRLLPYSPGAFSTVLLGWVSHINSSLYSLVASESTTAMPVGAGYGYYGAEDEGEERSAVSLCECQNADRSKIQVSYGRYPRAQPPNRALCFSIIY